ncbi:MAG: LamG domain-containing protein, partial [Crocinitomicaceae bacterium]
IVSTTDRFNNIMSALYFSGTGSEYLNYGDVEDYEPYQGSFSFWINPESYGGPSSEELKPIISKWSSPQDLSGSSYNIFLNGTDLCFLLSDGVTTDTLTAPLSNVLLNQWSHVVITANYGFIKIYINNVLVTDTISAISAFNITTSDFKVGGWYQDINASYGSFTGKIDDLGIWKREISSCEVDALYTGNICPTVSIQELDENSSELIQITDLMGRRVSYQPNIVQLYHYADGAVIRKYIIE